MKTLAQLDAITRQVSAFNDYADLCKSHDEHGYTPTLKPDDRRRGIKIDADNEAIRELRRALIADGRRVFPAQLPSDVL